jgi:hypothetical protein
MNMATKRYMLASFSIQMEAEFFPHILHDDRLVNTVAVSSAHPTELHVHPIVLKKVTVGWTCKFDGRAKESVQNFWRGTFWKSTASKLDKVEA